MLTFTCRWGSYLTIYIIGPPTAGEDFLLGLSIAWFTVVSTESSQPPMIADELRRQADLFTDLIELKPLIVRGLPS